MNKTSLTILLILIMLSIILFMLIFLMHEDYVHEVKRMNKVESSKLYNKHIVSYKEAVEVEPKPVLVQYFTSNSYHEEYIATNNEKIKLGDLTKYKIKKSKNKKIFKILKYTFSSIFLVLFLTLAGTGIYFKVTNKIPTINESSYVTVLTGSMEDKYKDNTYLESMNLNNQIEQFSLVELKKVKDVNEIKLFNIYAYLNDQNELIIHRIVKKEVIEGKTYYAFRGDSNSHSDYKLIEENDVLYSYTGNKNLFLGYIFSFINSIVGQVSIIYLVFAFLILDIYDSKKNKIFMGGLNKYIVSLNEIELRKFNGEMIN